MTFVQTRRLLGVTGKRTRRHVVGLLLLGSMLWSADAWAQNLSGVTRKGKK